jgi:hypothetical protein
VTSSDGGLKAVDALARQILKVRRIKPGSFPLVKLETTSYRHKIYGPVDKPLLSVQEWVTANGEPYPSNAAAPQRYLPPNGNDTHPAFDDDIPFTP